MGGMSWRRSDLFRIIMGTNAEPELLAFAGIAYPLTFFAFFCPFF